MDPGRYQLPKKMKRKLIKKSIRVDEEELEKAKRLLGLTDDSKVIRACMNFTVNVAQRLFGGNLGNMFKRRKDNEEVPLYDQNI